MTPEYLEFKKTVEKQRKVIARKVVIADKQRSILKEMLVGCPHEELTEDTYHFSGSYYDKAYTEHWMKCTICGEKGPVTTEHHSWYG